MVKSSLNLNFSLVTGVGTQESEDRSTKIRWTVERFVCDVQSESNGKKTGSFVQVNIDGHGFRAYRQWC